MTVAVSGCSSGVRLVYNQLDTLVPWYFRDYVDLETGQRQQFERALDTLLTWHRESQLGRYAAFLRELERDAEVPLGAARIAAARLEMEGFWDDLMRQVAPDAARILGSLSDEQVEQMFAQIAADDLEIEEKYAGQSAAERLKRREKTTIKQLERWVGRLDAAQRKMAVDCAADLTSDIAGWLASRRAWQRAFRLAMDGRQDTEDFTLALERLLADGDAFWPEEYRQRFNADRDRVLMLITEVDATLSPAQRGHLQERLRRLALDFESIAGGA